MGGRGSKFINYQNSNSQTSVDLGILLGILGGLDDDPDTELTHKGFTEKLKQKNVHIKQSTDNISEEILLENIKKVDEMVNKYKRSTKTLQKHNEELRIRSHELPSNAAAVFVSSATDFKNLQVVYNKDIQFMSKERLENDVKSQIDAGYWTKSDDLVNHTISHEYGHYLQRILMQRDIQKNNEDKARRQKLLDDIAKYRNNQTKVNKLVAEYSEEYATKYIKSVQRVCRKHFGRDYEKQLISRYGTENNREYFAEIFCNSETNTVPDDIGKAIKIFLNKKLN